jgi:hypothetical protein
MHPVQPKNNHIIKPIGIVFFQTRMTCYNDAQKLITLPFESLLFFQHSPGVVHVDGSDGEQRAPCCLCPFGPLGKQHQLVSARVGGNAGFVGDAGFTGDADDGTAHSSLMVFVPLLRRLDQQSLPLAHE